MMRTKSTLLAAIALSAFGISGAAISADSSALVSASNMTNHVVELQATEFVRDNGAILVNREGRRFVSETGAEDNAASAIANQVHQSAFLIFDDSVRRSSKNVEQYIEQGLVSTGMGLEQLGDALGIDGETLDQTVALYNRNVAKGIDLEFERLNERRQDMSVTLKGKHFYAIEVTPGTQALLESTLAQAKSVKANGV